MAGWRMDGRGRGKRLSSILVQRGRPNNRIPKTRWLQMEGGQTFSDERKLEGFVASDPTSKEWLDEVL